MTLPPGGEVSRPEYLDSWARKLDDTATLRDMELAVASRYALSLESRLKAIGVERDAVKAQALALKDSHAHVQAERDALENWGLEARDIIRRLAYEMSGPGLAYGKDYMTRLASKISAPFLSAPFPPQEKP